MSTIFISHSSANNGLALALRDWLVREGWHDLFLDIDVERGIVAGSRWLKALTEAGTRAKAVVFLITPEWIQSRYCHAEFFSAVEKGKPIFGLLAAKLHFNDIPVEMRDAWQLCDLINGSEFEEFTVAGPPSYLPEKVGLSKSGLAQLRRGLFEIGLGILDTESFAWPARGLECEPDGSPRRPWRGLEAIDEPDAGVFFGRDGAIHRALASISDLRASGGRELMVVLGASGSGKSSFLRAGLLPRLRRLDTAYLVLPLARPLDAAISGRFGLAASLQRALSEARQPANRSDLERELVGESNALSRRLDQIRSAATGSSVGEHKGRTLILPLDQAEELFQSGPSEAQALLGGLAEALRHGPEMIVIATIRTDSYEPLQRADIPQSVFPLSPLGPGEYRATIEGPIGRLKKDGRELTVEPDLIDKLVAEAAGPDALPLLGFVLQRLYEGYADDRILNLRDYEKLGGLGRCIDEAVSSALGGSGHTPQIALDEAAPVRMVALAFPALVSIDEEKQTPVRRIAQWSEIPELARPIVERLVAQRLLRSDLVGTQPVVEIAHEALLRHWPALDAWIAAERTNLASVQAVERASFEWHQRTRSEAWLLHRTERLANAEDIRTNRPELAARWGKLGDSYLRACRGIETKQRSRQLRTAWTVAAGASILVAIAGWLLVEERQQTAIADIAKAAAAEQGRLAEEAAGEALAQKALAEQAAARAREEAQEASRQSALLALDTARGLTEQGDLDQAILLALDAEQTLRGAANDSVLVTLAAIAARAGGQHVSNAGGDTNSLYSLPDGIFGLVRQGLEIVAVGPAGLARLGTLPEPGRVLGQTGHDAPLFVIGADWEARSFDPETGRVSVLGEIHPPERDAAIFGDDGLIITFDETNLHLFDVTNLRGASWQLPEDPPERFVYQMRYAKLPSGERIVGDEELLQAFWIDDDLSLVPLSSTELLLRRDELSLALCIGGNISLLPDVSPPLFDSYTYNRECRALNDYSLWVSETFPTNNVGQTTIDWIEPQEEYDDYNALLDSDLRLSREIGTSLVASVSSEGMVSGRLALAMGRTLAVLSADALLYRETYPSQITDIAFATLDQLAIALADGSVIWRSLDFRYPEEIDDRGSQPPPGNCSFHATLPLVLQNAIAVDDGPEPNTLRLSTGDATLDFEIGAGGCWQFSKQGSYLLLHERNGTGMEIFDISSGVRAGSQQAEYSLGTIFAGNRLRSPLFVGDTLDIVSVVGDVSVVEWASANHYSPTEIYRGDFFVMGVAPSDDGRQLILSEMIGSSIVSSLYSVESDDVWLDFGEVYVGQYVPPFFANDLAIVSLAAFHMPGALELTESVRGYLTPGCVPSNADDYRSSPCWPDRYR